MASREEHWEPPPRKPWLRQKRSKWAKEDTEAASLGIPDPLADFTVPQERDVLRARHRWDPLKKVYETTPVITEFMRLLVILVSDQFDCTR